MRGARAESRSLGVLDEAPEVGEPGALALGHSDGLLRLDQVDAEFEHL